MKVIPWMIALNIAVLCLFKYTNFFAETFAGLARRRRISRSRCRSGSPSSPSIT